MKTYNDIHHKRHHGKKFTLGALCSFLILGVYLCIYPYQVFAGINVCSSTVAFGVKYCHGYFSGAADTNLSGGDITDVLPGGISGLNTPNNDVNVTNAPDLINDIGTDLYLCSTGCNSSCSAQDCQKHRGAAFIVDTMMGDNTFANSGSFTTGIADAEDIYLVKTASGAFSGTWVNLVNSYCNSSGNCTNNLGPNPGSTYGVYWVSPTSMCGPGGPGTGSLNSGWSPNISDDVFHLSDCTDKNSQGNPLDSTPELEFFAPNNTTFIIGQNCGNVEHSAERLPNISTVNCGSLTLNPAQVNPSTPYSATVTDSYIGAAPPGPVISIVITPPGGTSTGTKAATVNSSTLTISATFARLGPTGTGGAFTATWTLTASGVSLQCHQSFQVASQPYLKVYGGDVMVGASPGTTPVGTCNYNSSAGIFDWNNYTTNFSGGGTEYAIEALGQIEGFASAQNSSSTPPDGLSFANFGTTAVNTTNDLFGGNFGGTTNDCDFTSDLIGVTQQLGSTVDPDIHVSGSDTYYATGNVYISHNILYCTIADTTPENTCPTETWANPASIPYFKLIVVGGDIYIDHSVTELDGLYVAEPDSSGNGGTIYTCTSATPSPANPSFTPSTIANYYGTCDDQLNIYGSFIAKQVQFLRTYGSVAGAGSDSLGLNDAAEVFDYTPELWLPRGSSSTGNAYDAITSLPPVL